MLVLLDTAIRVSELCSLTLDDVHEGYLKVFGKGRKECEVGMSPATAKFLWKYLHQHRAQADDAARALFTSLAGRPLSPWGVEQSVERGKVAAGITDVRVTAHKFRHTFARTWLERDGEVYSLSRLMGHSSVIYPTAEAGGLQLTRNDEVAACGLMTEARQNRSPAAEAPSGAYVKHFTLAPFPASNPLNVRLARCGANRCPRRASRCLITPSVYHEKESGIPPRHEWTGLPAARIVNERHALPREHWRKTATMSIRFGTFVPQGSRMDLMEIADPVANYQ